MIDYSNIDFTVNPLGQTVTMFDSEGNSYQAELSVIHAKSKEILDNLPEKINDAIQDALNQLKSGYPAKED